MNTIIITTHDSKEWNISTIENLNLVDYAGQCSRIIFNDANRKIIIYEGIQGFENHEITNFLNAITTPKIILFHQLDFNIEPKFNVSTVGDGIPNRPTYQRLLDAKFHGKIDTEIKRKAFDEVWAFFQLNQLMEKKIKLLNQILNCENLSDLNPPEELEDFNEVFKQFKEKIKFEKDIFCDTFTTAFTNFRNDLNLEK